MFSLSVAPFRVALLPWNALKLHTLKDIFVIQDFLQEAVRRVLHVQEAVNVNVI